MSLPHIPLHQTQEPQWLPHDYESHESSLTLLERQEKEYNARLEAIATLAGPEPIGTNFVGNQVSSAAGTVAGSGSMRNSNHGDVTMRRIASPSSAASSRRRRIGGRSSTTPNGPSGGGSMSTPPTRMRRSYEYSGQRTPPPHDSRRSSGGGVSTISRGSRRRSYDDIMDDFEGGEEFSFESNGGADEDALGTLVTDLIRSTPSRGSI